MPRIQTLTFTADYRTVAEAFVKMLKNPCVTEGEDIAGYPLITVEGDFAHFVLEEMDVWREHLKIEVKNFTITDSDDRESRAFLAQHMPGFGQVLFSPTVAYVYKRVTGLVRTRTITQHLQNNEVVNETETTQESEPQDEWVEITGEFGRKVKPGQM